MNEPQSTTDAGPVAVPDAATPAPPDVPAAETAPPAEPPASGATAAATAEPADGATARDADTAEDTLAEHVARTDAALVAWRQDAERRRAAWEAAQARALEKMRAQRRRVLRIAALTGLLGIGVGFAAGMLFYRTWWLPAGRGASLAPPPSSTAPVPDEPGSAVLPDVAEEVPPPDAEVVAPAPAPPPVALVEGSARVWTEGTHTWAAFESRETGALSLRYLDGAGAPALEPMECQGPGPDGVRRCAAGRSEARIAAALAGGAAPGTWTVQACGGQGCVPVGTFDVPGPGSARG